MDRISNVPFKTELVMAFQFNIRKLVSAMRTENGILNM